MFLRSALIRIYTCLIHLRAAPTIKRAIKYSFKVIFVKKSVYLYISKVSLEAVMPVRLWWPVTKIPIRIKIFKTFFAVNVPSIEFICWSIILFKRIIL